jgi:hypothetical protein
MGKQAKPAARKPAPKLRGRLRIITLGLEPELIEQIDAAAAAEHRNRTNMIEVMIHEGLKARRKAEAA